MDVVSSVGAIVALVFNFATAIKTCNDIRGRYKEAEKTVGSIRHELETLQGALQELASIM
jgi:nucleoside diphosphate kinase